jgi:hypothetical protein
MSDDGPAFTVETKLQRGTSTDDRDTIKASVAANDLDELDGKLAEMRERLETHAEQVRGIQPDDQTGGRRLADDQADLQGATEA